jgi:hypothetical protein
LSDNAALSPSCRYSASRLRLALAKFVYLEGLKRILSI